MTKTKTKKQELKHFNKEPKPYKFIYKSKKLIHTIKLFMFSEIKQNKKSDLKQITILGWGLLKCDDFLNFRLSILTFEIILTKETKPRENDTKNK